MRRDNLEKGLTSNSHRLKNFTLMGRSISFSDTPLSLLFGGDILDLVRVVSSNEKVIGRVTTLGLTG